jgi:hypothetical protein
MRRTVTKIVDKHPFQFVEPDATAGQLVTIPIFGEIWLAAKNRRPPSYCIVKREMFKPMKRIMVDEYGNRTLSGKHMGCMLDNFV